MEDPRVTEVTLIDEDESVLKIRSYPDDPSFCVLTNDRNVDIFCFPKEHADKLVSAINTICAG